MNKPSHLKRRVNGVLLLDKPMGITSHTAMQSVKRLFQAEKAGHTGSLDPLATGVLPIGLGEATKFSQYLLDADKSYVVAAQFGSCTTTGDSEGAVISKSPVPPLSQELLDRTLTPFLGEQDQIPPMYSALKHQGQPLYELARRGLVIDRPPRRITIFALKLLGHDSDTAELFVHCSKGTYIRTLVEDWGNALGCGAHVIRLRRVRVADYSESQIIDLESLQREFNADKPTALDHYLLPVDAMLQHLPRQRLDEKMIFDLQCGKAVVWHEAWTTGLIRLENSRDEFIGLGEVLSEGTIIPKRLMQTGKPVLPA